jgi:hypothetical protein
MTAALALNLSAALGTAPMLVPDAPNGTVGTFFESYGFIQCTHNYRNNEKMIVQNDSMGGHRNIITGKYAGFFVPPPLPSYCYMYFGTEFLVCLL